MFSCEILFVFVKRQKEWNPRRSNIIRTNYMMRHWEGQWEQTYLRRLLDALFLTYRNLANYGIVVLNLATVDAPGVIISQPMVYRISMYCILLACKCVYIWLYRVANVYSYRRGLWRCLFDYNRQCESLDTWNGQQDDSTLFLCLAGNKGIVRNFKRKHTDMSNVSSSTSLLHILRDSFLSQVVLYVYKTTTSFLVHFFPFLSYSRPSCKYTTARL